MIHEVLMFLEGRIESLLPELTERMHEAAAKLEFEKAARLRNQIRGLQALAERQKMVAQHHADQDYVGCARYGELACVQVFFVRGGKLVGRDHFLLDCSQDEDEAEILRSFLQQYYQDASYVPREVFVPVALEQPEVLESWLGNLRDGRVYLRVPQRGEKRQLLELVMKNAQLLLDEATSPLLSRKKLRKSSCRLQEVVDLSEPPGRIEAFRHLQPPGHQHRRFHGGLGERRFQQLAYRRFKIRGVEGAPMTLNPCGKR